LRTAIDPLRSYLAALRKAAPAVMRTLERELGLSRRAAAEAYAVTAAIIPSALARETRRRPGDSWAAMAIVRKHGRPEDLAAPELGVAGRLERRRLSPRLGGFLGAAGARLSAWAARRADVPVETMGRAIAALAPLALGALARSLPPQELSDWVAQLSDRVLADPEALLQAEGVPAAVHRTLERLGRPWTVRLLGLE
jgi:hypothetical protein